MGRHYQIAKYSWYNKTLKEAFFWESKDLLNYQRMNGDECVNVEAGKLVKLYKSILPEETQRELL